ncbi:MAG: hypothetical protein RL264_3128 [Bacteroidota bacterium]|jgi:NAD(P)-dependent dehydrogenase (short-subunit alcohol dehydrogenase family)
MRLNNKNILVFGGDSFLWDEMFVCFIESGAHIYWVNSPVVFESSTSTVEKKAFDTIQSIETYETFLNQNFEVLPNFDGVVFSLSIGALRPLNLTKHTNLASLFEVNCMAFVELVRILNKKKKINDGGSILAYSSVSSLMGLKTKLAYAVSKAALNSAVINLAAELSSKKIRVNGILKGALTTDVNHEHVKNMFTVSSDTAGNQELGMSTPTELANLSIFLLCDQVKTMTGTLVKLDGGYSLG